MFSTEIAGTLCSCSQYCAFSAHALGCIFCLLFSKFSQVNEILYEEQEDDITDGNRFNGGTGGKVGFHVHTCTINCEVTFLSDVQYDWFQMDFGGSLRTANGSRDSSHIGGYGTSRSSSVCVSSLIICS